MAKKILYIAILALTISTARAQISSHIENKASPNPAYRGSFSGYFDFENLPEPLKPTRVKFTLEVLDKIEPGRRDIDWNLKLQYVDNAVRINSDTLFTWPGPHKPGDRYSNYIEFVPLMSGAWDITLEHLGAKGHISFQWCIDCDGELKYLGQRSLSKGYCTPIRTMFFESDSIFINQFPDSRGRKPFDYGLTIKPIPQIGDTFSIFYHFIANYDISENYKMMLEVYNMDVVSLPEKLVGPIPKNSKIAFELKLVPRAVSDALNVMLSISDCSISNKEHPKSQLVPCTFIFSDDGSLKYVNDIKLGDPRHASLPQSFPKKIESKKRKTVFYIKSE